MSLLQERALFASFAVGLKVEAGLGALWIVWKQLKRDDGEHDALIVVGDEFAPAVLGARVRLREVGGAQRTPRVKLFHIRAHRMNA